MMVNLSRMRLFPALLALGFAMPALASADPLVNGARQCTQQFPVQESANGIPTHLLAAISSTESGRWHDKLGLALPWPWTINVEGKGYYFDSKAEAIAKTTAFLQAGKRSIDIGCMQVNLKHHPNAFRNLDEAFDPRYNVAYGAKFLRSNYDELGDWIKATASYHSRTNQRGKEYLARIEKSWNRIVSKVQQARVRQGMQPAAASGPAFDVAALGAPAEARAMRPLASTRNVKVISVSDRPRAGASEVMVVRHADTLPPAADPAADMLVKGSGDQPRRVTIDNRGGSSESGGQSSATRFVFAN